MISKEQFLTIKRLKQEGVPIAAIARRIGYRSRPHANGPT